MGWGFRRVVNKCFREYGVIGVRFRSLPLIRENCMLLRTMKANGREAMGLELKNTF